MLFHLFWANSGYDQSMFTILFSVPAIFCRYDWQFKVNFSILFINILFDQIPLYNILIENPVHCIITTCEKSVGFAVFCLFGFFFSGLVPRKLYGRTFVYIITFKISHFPQKHLFIFIKGFIRLVFLAKWGFLLQSWFELRPSNKKLNWFQWRQIYWCGSEDLCKKLDICFSKGLPSEREEFKYY